MKTEKENKDKEYQDFQQFLAQRQELSHINQQARKYSHPLIYMNFKRHQYSKYAIKHRYEIDTVSGLTRKQGFDMLKSLFHNLSGIKKAIIIIFIIIIIWCICTELPG